MLEKARTALQPGGTLAILESAHEKRQGDISQTGGFNELFFFLVSGAQAYLLMSHTDHVNQAA